MSVKDVLPVPFTEKEYSKIKVSANVRTTFSMQYEQYLCNTDTL